MNMEQLTKEHKVQFYTKVNTQQYFFILPYYHWGRAPDIHIVWDSGFLKIGAIWPRWQNDVSKYRV